MKRLSIFLVVILGFAALALSLVSAQPRGVSLYGGIQLPNHNIRIEYSAPAGRTTFSLERILNVEALLGTIPDLRKPVLPAITKTRFVRRLKRVFKQEDYDSINFGHVPVGVYVVRATNGNFTSSTLLIVSDLGLIVKRGANQALTYTANRFTGQTRAAKVWQINGNQTIQSTANADGIAHFSVNRNKEPIFIANAGQAWAISGTYWNTYAAPTIKGYVYTDRPVYRPGQRVEFKGILRDAKTFRAVQNTRVNVSVKDSDDQEIYKKTLVTSNTGAFDDGLQLAKEPSIGSYSINVTTEQSSDTQSGSFIVEAYVKPEYAVTITPSQAKAVQGDKVRVLVDAKYLFGGKVSGGRVQYNVTRANYYAYEYDDEVYDGSDNSRDYGSDLVIQEETRLNQQGQIEILLPLERNQEGNPQSYRIEASVEDESRRTVSASTRVVAFPSSITVSSRTDSYIYEPRKPISVTLSTKNLEDKGVPARVSLELVRQDWVNTKKSGWTQIEKTVSVSSGRTNANGVNRFIVRAPKGGGYMLRTRVKDSSGRVSHEENFIWVLEAGDNWYWNYRDLSLKFDQKSYQPGQIATLLIGSPKPGTPVLVTIEGNGIRKAEVIRSKAAAIAYRINITKAFSPNVFVSATMLSNENQYEQSTRLRVPDVSTQLSLTIKANKAKYAPGDTGKFDFNITDSTGQGVASEFSLGVVDEAIYLVQADTTTDIHSFFHGLRDNEIGSSSSLSFNFESTITARRGIALPTSAAAPNEALNKAAFAQSKDESAQVAGEDKVRQDFKDTALWVPKLITDENGHATIDITYPDNLTTYRATAKGIDTNGRAGQTTAKILVTKDVLTRLILPPFLVQGDTATVSAIVNNNLSEAVTGDLNFELRGLAAISTATSRTPSRTMITSRRNTVLDALQENKLNIPAFSRTRIDLGVRAENSGMAVVAARAVTTGGQDAIQLPLNILPRGYQDTLGFASDTAAGRRTFNLPEDANLESANLKLSITPSLVSAVTPALEYLLGYPYGCTEQTMSRFLPALLARQTLGTNALPKSVTDQLPEWSEVGLKRLLDFQHEDGGWGFWSSDQSTLEMSAYVFSGLTRAKALGLKVPNDKLNQAVRYLNANTKNQDFTQGERSSAYRALADAGRADRAGMNALSKRTELKPYALANLSLAHFKIGDLGVARDLLDRLKAKRIQNERGIHWQNERQQYGWYFYWDDNEIQITATALEAIARLEPNNSLISSISNWLLMQRRGAQWISTQDTATVIQAALALEKPARDNIKISVRLNDEQAIEQTANSSTGTLMIELPNTKLETGLNTIDVKSDTNITYSFETKFTREPKTLKADASKGIRVTRKYERLNSIWDTQNKRYGYEREPLSKAGTLQPITVGDLVLVTLTVQTKDPARYVMISDPLPAGLKALDERSLMISGLQDGTDGFEEWRYWYSGREFRDERVDMYAYYTGRDRQVMRYVLRAQTPGVFTALPTKAFFMYEPEIRGFEKSSTLTVRDRGQ